MLDNFNFKLTTEIVFGDNSENEICNLLAKYNAKKILIVIGKGYTKSSGLLNAITSLLNDKFEYQILEGVRANPTFNEVIKGIELVKKYNLDFILPIGGGSVIDTAKCIAVNANYEGDIHDFNLHKATPSIALPIGVILTISAAGSEMSTSCVIQDDSTQKKQGFNSELVRPKFVIENPTFTLSVSKEQTAYGIVDIIMHSLERYFSYSDNNELADEFALGIIKNTYEVGLKAYQDLSNKEYRAKLMLNSSLSHNGLTNIGKKIVMPIHQLEHALSGYNPSIAHGAGLAVLLPGWNEYYLKLEPSKFAYLGRRVFNLKDKNDLKCAKKTNKCFKEFFKSINMPLSLNEFGIKKGDIDNIVNLVSENHTKIIPHHIKPMDYKVMEEIYLSVLE